MYLIVGLGNPGTEYERTRHNAGFMVLDEFAEQHGFPEFRLSKKHSSLVSEGFLGKNKVVLAKPQTFMNNSGPAVRSLLSNTSQLPRLIIVHDEIDLPLGAVRLSRGSGSAGHKGVDSIIQTLGTKTFARIRIGIQPKKGKPDDVEAFVLKPFLAEERETLKTSMEAATRSLLELLGQ
jgi:PTH1 family peptidyl-tRNA hydrolase